MAIELPELVQFLDRYLKLDQVPDYAGALNGLQVEGEAGRPIRRIAAAVDAAEATVSEAVDREADLLLVHHGLFWDGNRPVTGRRFRRLAPLIRSGTALYSAHLPLDAHEEVGNNAVLARELGVEVEGRFGDYKGLELGLWGRLDTGRDELRQRLEELLGRDVQVIGGGPQRIQRVGVITGGGGSFVAAALERGLDALVTGEGSHHTYFDATEGGLNLYYGGHYATETWGVRALAELLADRFDLDWSFIDHPTGL